MGKQVPLRIQQAAAVVRAGGVIAYPTEAVWGLGCDPVNEAAVQRILDLKQRPRSKGLILIAASMQQLENLLDGLSTEQLSRLEQSWPGPVTWLIPHQNRLGDWVTGDHQTVAVRVSAHPVVQQLCLAVQSPLISTSANPAGQPEARELSELQAYFGTDIDDIVPGNLGGANRPSTIRDLLTGETIRAG